MQNSLVNRILSGIKNGFNDLHKETGIWHMRKEYLLMWQ